jgi:hypothetical protein
MKYAIREFVSIHIPRTGGTTFRNVLNHIYGQINIYHDTIYRKTCAAIQLPEYKVLDLSDVSFLFGILHGHFLYEKYEYRNLPYIVWVRDPAKIVSSIYNVLKRKNLRFQSFEAHKAIQSGASIREFAQIETVRNLMYKFIQGESLDKFEFVGVTEIYNESLKRFAQWANVPLPKSIKVFNKMKYDNSITEADLNFIRSLNEKDVNIYRQAIRRYQ